MWGTAFTGNGSHTLRLASNQITGVLPPSWQPLVWKAEVVDLSGNALNGGLPVEWNNTAALAGVPVGIVQFAVRCGTHAGMWVDLNGFTLWWSS